MNIASSMKQIRNKKKSFLKKWIVPIIISFALVFIIKSFFFQSYVNSNKSMHKTVVSGDFIYVNKQAKVSLNDIVLLVSPVDNKRYFKRIVALPGDTFSIKNKRIFINNIETELSNKVVEKYRIISFDPNTYNLLTTHYNIINIKSETGYYKALLTDNQYQKPHTDQNRCMYGSKNVILVNREGR